MISHAVMQGRGAVSKPAHCLIAAQHLAVQRNQLHHTSIHVLLRGSYPSAISRLVTLVVVDAIDRFCVRYLSHIRKEFGEILPPFTHRNTTRPIVLVCGRIHVLAAGNHSTPYAVRSALGHRMLPAGIARFGVLALQAAARFGIAMSQTWLNYRNLISTFASRSHFINEVTLLPARHRDRLTHDRQSIESISNFQRSSCWHVAPRVHSEGF